MNADVTKQNIKQCTHTDTWWADHGEEIIIKRQISEKYVARVDGTIVSVASSQLAASRNISDEDLQSIVAGHCVRYTLCKKAESLPDTEVDHIKQLHEQFIQNEYSLQSLWGFDPNSNFHRWWDFPHCSCPTLDNEDLYGTKYDIHVQGCIIHGWKDISPSV